MVGNRRQETESHNLLKHLVAAVLRSEGHEVSIEHNFSSGFNNGKIADIFDKTTGLVYEVQTTKQTKVEMDKVRQYTKYCEVNDVIFIYPVMFRMQNLLNSALLRDIKKKLGAKS